MKKIIIYTNIFLLILSSCITEVEFDDEFIAPKLVVNGFISPDSLIKINVSTTRSIIGFERNYPTVQNAKVDVYEDGSFIEELNYIETIDTIWGQRYVYNDDLSKDSDSYNPYTTEYYIESFDTIAYYLGSFYPNIGKEYQIVVKKEGFETVRANATIPDIVPILGIDTTISKEVEPNHSSIKMKVAIKFQDPGETENFYRLKVNYKHGYLSYFEDQDGDPNTPDSIPVVVLSEWYENYSLESDDIILVGEEGADDILFGTPSNRYNIFEDKLISGIEHDLTFYNYDEIWENNNGYIQTEYGEFNQMSIHLESISKESFLYMQSYTNFEWIDGDLDMFIEPVQVYNNIENGVGIFGAASSDSYTLSKGVYPMDGVKYVLYY